MILMSISVNKDHFRNVYRFDWKVVALTGNKSVKVKKRWSMKSSGELSE